MPLAPDVPYEIGDPAFGGYVAGIIDTTRPGSIIASDASQNGLRYVLIVAPASLDTSRQWAAFGNSPLSATRTRWDGLTSTLAMNDSAQSYPAAEYCAGLSYPSDNGSPWYLPALDELEVLYRNLKPTTAGNWQETGASGGSFPGGTRSIGENPSTDPIGAPYTTVSPAQTAATAFRIGGSQALGTVNTLANYWSSTEDSEQSAWVQVFTNTSGSLTGNQQGINKTSSYRVRPVRRVLVSDLNTAPDAPTLTTPADGETINRQQAQTFQWQFNDPDPGDSQSAYNWAYRLVGAATWTETGWVAVTSSQHTVPAGTFALGDYEWRVYTKDAQGVESPPSATGFFTAGDPPPAPTITDPANNGTIPSEEYQVTWSTPDQAAYQLQLLDADGVTVLYDTLQVNSVNRYRTVTFPDNNVQRTVRVRVLFGGLWSAWATVTVTVSYTPPAQPTVTLTPDGAALVVTATHPAPVGDQPTVTGMDVWVRGGPEGEFRLAADVPPSQPVTWYLPASGVEYEARVRAIGDNGTSTWSEWSA